MNPLELSFMYCFFSPPSLPTGVLWGSLSVPHHYAWTWRVFISSNFLSLSPQASCEALSSYLTTTLNPYVANVTAAAQLCSDFLCQGNGRCVRKHYESDHYLHLSSGNFRILWARGTYMVLGTPSLAYLTLFSRRFTCQCYAGWTCSPKLPIHLSKALVFRLKHQGLSDKTKTLNKVIADMEQSTIKENLNKHWNTDGWIMSVDLCNWTVSCVTYTRWHKSLVWPL